MIAAQLPTCAGTIVGAFLILGLKPVEFTDSLFAFLLRRRSSTREGIWISTSRKKAGSLKREIMEAQTVLEMTRRSGCFSLVCVVSLALSCIGGSITILLGNLFMTPVLAVGFMFLSFWYVKLAANHYKKGITVELETALSVVTTAYLRIESIVTAVDENIVYLDPPVSEVSREFLMQIKLINPGVEAVLRTMKSRIDNEVPREWYDALHDCQYDRSLRTTLTLIVTKLSDMRNVSAELKYLIVELGKEFLVMVLFVVDNTPLMHLLNREWYDILMHTPLGQTIPAVTTAVTFIPASLVAEPARSIGYRR